MKKYIFYDSDISGNADYDIKGKCYEKLIHFCSSKCPYFTLMKVADFSPIFEELEAYIIERPAVCPIPKAQYISSGFKSYNIYYRVCRESISVLLRIGSVFSYLWDNISVNPPEDLTFYRSNGSVFFSSVTHEGECALYLEDNEETDIVLNSLWHRII